MQSFALQRVLSGEMRRRRIFVRPPEPPPEILIGNTSDSVYIGKTSLFSVPFFWDYKALANPHIAVMGMTGSGKSYLVKAFLSRAATVWRSNALILDWAGEYVPWVESSGGKVLRLGAGHALNILDTGGADPRERARHVIGSLEILTDIGAYPRQKRITEEAVLGAYKLKKIKAGHANPEKMPTLRDVADVLSRTLSRDRKNDDVDASLHRVRQFLQDGRDYFASKSTISLGSLAESGLVCVDLSALPSEADRSLAGLAILQFLKERMRTEGYSHKKALKLVIVVDEAWKIAQDDRSDLVAIIREGRKYSFGLVVASQNPTDMSKTILSNAATVFVFRLQLPEFKSYVQQALHYGQQIADQIEHFGVGQAAVSMAYEQGGRNFGPFVLSRVDGQEMQLRLKIRGVGMDLEVDRDEFHRSLSRLGCSDAQVKTICDCFEKNSLSLTAADLAHKLSKMGFGRSAILSFLRDEGFADCGLAGVFSQLQARRGGMKGENLLQVVVEDG